MARRGRPGAPTGVCVCVSVCLCCVCSWVVCDDEFWGVTSCILVTFQQQRIIIILFLSTREIEDLLRRGEGFGGQPKNKTSRAPLFLEKYLRLQECAAQPRRV